MSVETNAIDIFSKVIHQKYESESDAYEYVLLFSKAFLSEDLSVDLRRVAKSESSLRRAGYFFDFLSRYPNVSKERKKKIKEMLEGLREDLNTMTVKKIICENSSITFYRDDKPDPLSMDSLAKAWGLRAGLHASRHRELLDLQRRVYAPL